MRTARQEYKDVSCPHRTLPPLCRITIINNNSHNKSISIPTAIQQHQTDQAPSLRKFFRPDHFTRKVPVQQPLYLWRRKRKEA